MSEVSERDVGTSVDICSACRAVIDAVIPLVPDEDVDGVWQTALVLLVAEVITDYYEPEDHRDVTKLFVKALIRSVPIAARKGTDEALQ